MLLFKLIAIGLFVGIASSMFGIGGGILVSPMLPFVAAITQREAVATSLLCILVVVGINTYSYWKKGLVHTKLALIFGGLASLGSMTASLYSQYVSDYFIRFVTGVLLLWIGIKLIANKKSQEESIILTDKKIGRLNYLLGFLAGSASGFSGLGTGVLLSPLFMHKRWVAPNQIAPTMNAILTMTSFFGAMGYIAQRDGLVHYDLAFWIILSALIVSYMGRKFNDTLKEITRRRVMAVFIFGLALLVLVPVIWSYVKT